MFKSVRNANNKKKEMPTISIFNRKEKNTCKFGLKFIFEPPSFIYLGIQILKIMVLFVLLLTCVIRIYWNDSC